MNHCMLLCMVETELTVRNIQELLCRMDASKSWFPIEFHDGNTAAYGFIESKYYEEIDFESSAISEDVNCILADWKKVNVNCIYHLKDGNTFCMFFGARD